MSEKLLDLAINFLKEDSGPNIFVDRFIDNWKRERDDDSGRSDSAELSAVLSTIFCLADMFNAAEDRESYELDESNLRLQILKTLREANFF